jgi:hypothetical protein
MRLTKFGHGFITKFTNSKFAEVNLSHDINSKHLLQLERLIAEPYYLKYYNKNNFAVQQKHGTIYLLGEQDALMLLLHAGNLAQYLDNLQS